MGERFEPYSVRQKRKRRAGDPVIYQYDEIPFLLRAQVMHALRLASRCTHIRVYEDFWASVVDIVAAEHGFTHRLPRGSGDSDDEDLIASYLVDVDEMEYFLDVIEIALHQAYRIVDKQPSKTERREALKFVDEAVDEINYRFSLHNVGYRYAGAPGGFIREDTQYVHREIVEPAIMQLHIAGWKGPEDEFLSAHRHYRCGEHKAAMNDALKAFESTMKAILIERGYEFDPNGSASYLVQILINNGVISSSLSPYLNGVKQVLGAGVPTLRNKLSGHGQGPNVTDVPGYVAGFALNLTASNIVFLAEANAALDKK